MDYLRESHMHKTFATTPSGRKVHMLTQVRDVQVIHQVPYQLELFCECGAPMDYYVVDGISNYLLERKNARP